MSSGGVTPAPGGGSQTLAEVLVAGGDPEGNPVTGSVAVTPAVDTPGLTITSASTNTTKLLNLTGGHTTFTLDCDGTFSYASDDSAFMLVNGTGGTSAVLQVTDTGTHHVVVGLSSSGGITSQAAGNKTDLIQGKNNVGNRVFRVRTDSVMIRLNAAPADADLGTSEMALWLDSTNGVGASKFMVKAKQADGTVVTGSVVLT